MARRPASMSPSTRRIATVPQVSLPCTAPVTIRRVPGAGAAKWMDSKARIVDSSKVAVAHMHDRLGARAHAEFVEDTRNLIAHGLLALVQLACDRGVAEAERDEPQHLALGACQSRFVRRRVGGLRRRRAEKAAQLAQKVGPRRLAVKQHMVVAV